MELPIFAPRKQPNSAQRQSIVLLGEAFKMLATAERDRDTLLFVDRNQQQKAMQRCNPSSLCCFSIVVILFRNLYNAS
jgi:hypothetical protein